MIREIVTVCVVLAVGSAVSVSATVLRVPSEYPTIQAGIDAALEGDTVLVADGVYTGDGNRDLDFGGVNMVVMSENGPEVTIIDCEGDSLDPHRGFYLHTHEDSTSGVYGFTIKNGYAHGKWPQKCGGGIQCWDSSPRIVDNIIMGNSASAGGGIYYRGAFPIIEGNRIIENTAFYVGGGMTCYWYARPAGGIIMDNVIASNTAGTNGGGLNCQHPSLTIVCNRIMGNAASSGAGGGIFCSDGELMATGNTIAGNTSFSWGGGVFWQYSSAIIDRNYVIGNAASDGGGLFCGWHSVSTIVSNTITGNSAASAGAVHCWQHSSSVIMHTIVWGDSSATGEEVYVDTTSSIAITYSDVQGGFPGEGNIDADPRFVLADKRDCRLLWESPCIDAGHPDSLDPDGTRRDMGAHFFDQDDYMTLYLTPDTTEVSPGGVLGVTYTAINRWAQPEPFWVLTEAILPNGNPKTLMGPDQYGLPAETTVQRHLNHTVPGAAPVGLYGYQSKIGVPPATLYDEDSFEFAIVPPPVE